MNIASLPFTIKDIDTSISKELQKLDIIIEKLQFQTIGEFTLNENSTQLCDAQYSHPGIYLFELKNSKGDLLNKDNWIVEFTQLWQDPQFHYWAPNLKKIRIRKHPKFQDWIPLYIGKSKNVGYRINEHILKDLKKTTFAMKLKARKNLYGQIFRVSIVKTDVAEYDLIVPYIEKELREKYNPIIGKQ